MKRTAVDAQQNPQVGDGYKSHSGFLWEVIRTTEDGENLEVRTSIGVMPMKREQWTKLNNGEFVANRPNSEFFR